jgi:hypothetical protein
LLDPEIYNANSVFMYISGSYIDQLVPFCESCEDNEDLNNFIGDNRNKKYTKM